MWFFNQGFLLGVSILSVVEILEWSVVTGADLHRRWRERERRAEKARELRTAISSSSTVTAASEEEERGNNSLYKRKR